jgi:YbbR domain-containing protein
MTLLAPLRWFFSNLSTLFLSFALAVVVWISAVTAANPNVERIRSVTLKVNGLDANMLVVSDVPTQVRITLRAPRSVADSLVGIENAIEAQVDVTGLGAGTYDLEVKTHIDEAYRPVRLVLVNPEIVTLTLEPLVALTLPVNLDVSGDPAIGYQKGPVERDPSFVTISGAASLVAQVEEVQATLDISDSRETLETDVPALALDAAGEPVPGVVVAPNEIRVTQPVFLQGGYRNVIVKVVTSGRTANGYKLTNITVSPLNVVVFSTDPQLVNDLPGYVETQPVDLDGAEDDVDSFVVLNLPDGVSVVGDQSVLVQVSIAAIEGSLTVSLPVTPIGLLPTHAAAISPETVDVILSGPVPILNSLDPSEIRVVVALDGLDLGIYQLEPEVDILPGRVRVETILPSTVEVTIIIAPTPTPTGIPLPTPLATVQP